MDFDYYLDQFKKAADSLDQHQLHQKGLEVATGIVLDSVYLKIFKRAWTNDNQNPLDAEARIFFSVWVHEKTLYEHKIFYNIHAFKLRKLKNYTISSREFAESFRKNFQKHQGHWQNVSMTFGPLTLMQGWVNYDKEHLQEIITALATNFSTIDSLIDDTLTLFKK